MTVNITISTHIHESNVGDLIGPHTMQEPGEPLAKVETPVQGGHVEVKNVIIRLHGVLVVLLVEMTTMGP